jgi:transposase InsO family protein
MSVRRLIVEVDPATLNVTEFCATHRVSTWFFWDLRRRHRAEGDAALEPRSRAPHTVANRTPDAVVELMIEVHKDLASRGLDAGAESVWDNLPARLDPGTRCPSASTIYRHLRARGFTKVEPRKTPRRALHRFVAERVNERWQIDATDWCLADDTTVEIIDIIDDCSRLLPGSLVVARCTADTALQAITGAAQRWGWPADVLSDNGAAFRGWPGDHHNGGLAAALNALGITTSRSRPYHPQTCGKIERVHQTIKQHLATLAPARTIDELQTQLDTFTDYYNHRRRHRAIGRRTPAAVFATTARSGPAQWPLDTPTTVHHSTVSGGSVWAGKHYRISVGNRHDHQRATIVTTGLNAHVFTNGHLIRQLTLDPTRTNQPLRSTERDVSRQP